VLSYYIKDILVTLLAHAKKLHLPVREASLTGVWYFKQFEEVIKDTFRLFWALPAVRDVLSACSNIPVYNTQYLLPLSLLCNDALCSDIMTSPEDVELLKIIRLVYDQSLQGYVCTLYNYDPKEMANHFTTWRANSLVVVSMDLASGRNKMKSAGSAR
jgi:hypothetical protein